jgi:hypothetical protein
MSEKKNAPNFKVDIETAERLRLLSAKSGFSVAHLLRELSQIYDMLPDSCDRVILGIFPKIENRSITFIASPLYCGSLPSCSNETSDEEVDKRIRKALEEKIGLEGREVRNKK